MLLNIYTLVMVLLLFGITIFVHELGHFLVARWCGLVIETFSIGFGPAIWKRKIKGVVYKIGCLPFGGYVALPQMDPTGGAAAERAKTEAGALPVVEPWKKILVALAGVTGNIILAVLIAYGIYAVKKSGVPASSGAIIGYVETNSLAHAEGLAAGDTILSVNRESVAAWEDFALVSALNESVDLGIRTADGKEKTVTLPTEKIWMGGRYVPGLFSKSLCIVVQVNPDSPADQGGLKTKDVILSADGVKIFHSQQFIEMISRMGSEPVKLTVQRKGDTLERTVVPEFNEKYNRALIGVQLNMIDVLHKRPAEHLRAWSVPIFRFLRALVTPKESKEAASAVRGPVFILQMFWYNVRVSFLLSLWFTGLVNINLAILNLLPIPVLDGGHLVLSLGEWITRRRASPKVVGFVWNLFAILLISLILFLSYKDVLLLFGRRKAEKEAEKAGEVAPTNTVPEKAAPVTP